MFEDCSAHVGCGFCCLVASCSDGLHTLNEKNINSRTLFHLMLAESRHCFNILQHLKKIRFLSNELEKTIESEIHFPIRAENVT